MIIQNRREIQSTYNRTSIVSQPHTPARDHELTKHTGNMSQDIYARMQISDIDDKAVFFSQGFCPSNNRNKNKAAKK